MAATSKVSGSFGWDGAAVTMFGVKTAARAMESGMRKIMAGVNGTVAEIPMSSRALDQ
jgi:hypothetical protein